MHLIYNFCIVLYGKLIAVFSLFDPKAKDWVRGRGRANIWHSLPKNKEVYWFHCASLGEFDQGLPIMKELKSKVKDAYIVVTFFSPSGMNHFHKRDHCVDSAYYLELDTKKNARNFIEFFQPKAAFFVKYEFWANYIFEAKKKGVKLFSVSAVFRSNQIYFKWYGSFFRKILRSFDFFYLQTKESKELLNSIGFSNTVVSGDSRYDKVHENYLMMKNKTLQNKSEMDDVFIKFLDGKKAIVIGSSWPVEEKMALQFIIDNPDRKFILAPHDISESHIKQITSTSSLNIVRYTDFDAFQQSNNCLLLDTIGHLSTAYHYGSMAFIGGGFSGKLHNILEPSVFGLPTFFGPNVKKFPEAELFLKNKISFKVENLNDIEKTVDFIDENSKELKIKTQDFVVSLTGASQKIINHYLNL